MPSPGRPLVAARTSDAAAASAAMTISQHLEMHLTGRPPSDAPVATVERLAGISIPDGPARVVVGTCRRTCSLCLPSSR